MENCVCRAPYGRWSSESILLQGKIMSPECICLYCVQVRKEGSYFPCLAGMQIVESKTPFTPTQGSWKRPLFLNQEAGVWLPPYLCPADHKMHQLYLEHPNKSSKVTLKIRLCQYRQQSGPTHSRGGLLTVKRPPQTKHTCLLCTVWINTSATKTSDKLRLRHMRWMQREQADCSTHHFLSKTEESITTFLMLCTREKPAKLPQLLVWHLLSCSGATEDHKVKTEQCIWQVSAEESKQGDKKRFGVKLLS